MNVLIVIDMQKSLFANPRLNAELVIENINQMAATVRQHQGQVIYIQHNGSEEENLARGSAGWALLDTLDIQPADLKIEKTICDAFYGNDLLEAVTRLAPERLIIMGCASDFCVDTTIRSAVSHRFNVFVTADGHTTAERPHLDAAAIIEHHNWMWTHLITPNKPVSVLNTRELLMQINSTEA